MTLPVLTLYHEKHQPVICFVLNHILFEMSIAQNVLFVIGHRGWATRRMGVWECAGMGVGAKGENNRCDGRNSPNRSGGILAPELHQEGRVAGAKLEGNSLLALMQNSLLRLGLLLGELLSTLLFRFETPVCSTRLSVTDIEATPCLLFIRKILMPHLSDAPEL